MHDLPLVPHVSSVPRALLGGLYQWLKRGAIAQRVVFGVMSALGVALVYMMRYCLSIAITAMVKRHPSPETNITVIYPYLECPFDQANSTYSTADEDIISEGDEVYDWDEETQGMILSAFYYGYIITHVPGSMLAERFGGKHIMGLSVLSTAVFTILTPFTVSTMGAPGLIGLRFLSGLGEGTKFPALTTLLAAWAPPLEQSRLISLCFAGSQLGMIIGNGAGGVLVHYWGWPSVFYVFGTVGLLWFLVWCSVCYSDPESHPFISDQERLYLAEAIGATKRDKDLCATPWCKLLTSGCVWALVFAEIGHCWGLYTLTTDLPKYLSDVLHFNIAQSGLLSGIPFLAMWLTSMLLGVAADWILTNGYLSTWTLRRMFATLGQVGPGVGVILVSYAGCDKMLVIVLLSVSMALMSACYSSVRVNSLDLSTNYAGSIMALQNGISSISGMITPHLIGVLTPNRSLMEWRVVFYLMFAVLFVCNWIFVWLGSAKLQPWNNCKKETDNGQHQLETQEISDQPENLKECA